MNHGEIYVLEDSCPIIWDGGGSSMSYLEMMVRTGNVSDAMIANQMKVLNDT